MSSRKRPHSVSALSTLSRAIALALGLSMGSPASGSITTRTVCERKMYSGKEDLFLSLAPAEPLSNRAKATGKRRRIMGPPISTPLYSDETLEFPVGDSCIECARLLERVFGRSLPSEGLPV